MALPLLAPALFFFGGNILKAGSKKIGEQMLKAGFKRATSKQIKDAKGKVRVNTTKQINDIKSNKNPTNKGKSAAIGTITTIASLPLMSAMQKKDTKPANASTPKASTPSKTRGKTPDRSKDTNERQQRVVQNRGNVDAKKTWKDVKSVAAAKSAGLKHFTGRDGKKKIAITKEELNKKGMSLNQYANSLRK